MKEPLGSDGESGTLDWLLHIDGVTRTRIHSLLVEALSAVEKTPSKSWTNPARPSRVIVNRALSLPQGGRRSACFSARDDSFSLISPAYSVARRDRVELTGVPPPDDLPADPGESYAATLRWWIANLADAPDAPSARRAADFRLDVLRLALGVIEVQGIDWRWFRVMLCNHGGHTIVVQPWEPGARPMAFWSGKHGGLPKLSPELLSELDRLVGRHVHVSLFMDHRPGDAPWVSIGWPPELVMARSERDDQPMLVLDSIRTIPAGARLL